MDWRKTMPANEQFYRANLVPIWFPLHQKGHKITIIRKKNGKFKFEKCPTAALYILFLEKNLKFI
jgi:hypothetical protein